MLLRLCRGDRLKTIGMSIYGVSLLLCYAGGALFHAVPIQSANTFALLDHIGIYALIAGTVTPIGLIVLRLATARHGRRHLDLGRGRHLGASFQ